MEAPVTVANIMKWNRALRLLQARGVKPEEDSVLEEYKKLGGLVYPEGAIPVVAEEEAPRRRGRR